MLTDDAISRISQSSLVTAAQSDTASQMYSVVKDQVSNFAHHSKTLMNVLDAVGEVHPFIKRTSGLFSRYNIVLILCIVAVSLFKGVLTMEIQRRENDDKVIALNLTMCNMMETLKL